MNVNNSLTLNMFTTYSAKRVNTPIVKVEEDDFNLKDTIFIKLIHKTIMLIPVNSVIIFFNKSEVIVKVSFLVINDNGFRLIKCGCIIYPYLLPTISNPVGLCIKMNTWLISTPHVIRKKVYPKAKISFDKIILLRLNGLLYKVLYTLVSKSFANKS